MFGPSAFMLLSSRFWKKPKDAHHKHHSSEAFQDNMHVMLLQTSALLLQLVVETIINATITQKKWLNEALTTQKLHRNHIDTIEQSTDEQVIDCST